MTDTPLDTREALLAEWAKAAATAEVRDDGPDGPFTFCDLCDGPDNGHTSECIVAIGERMAALLRSEIPASLPELQQDTTLPQTQDAADARALPLLRELIDAWDADEPSPEHDSMDDHRKFKRCEDAFDAARQYLVERRKLYFPSSASCTEQGIPAPAAKQDTSTTATWDGRPHVSSNAGERR